MINLSDDEVSSSTNKKLDNGIRSPIPSFQGTILPQTFRQTYGKFGDLVKFYFIS